MRRSWVVLAVIAAFLMSLFVTGQVAVSPTAAHAQSPLNPAGFQKFRAPISPAGILGLSRTRSTSSGIHTADQGDFGGLATLLHAHKVTGQAVGAGQVTGGPGPQGGTNTVPPNSLLFNNDPSALEQNETSVTVRQNGTPTAGANTDAVVGGVNDFRGFYYVPQYGCGTTSATSCYPARNCVSLSGFSVSLDSGQHLAKSGCLPWVNNTYQPFGDPSLDRNTSGDVYYGGLGFDQTANSSNNGITIFASTPELFNPSNPCENVAAGSPANNSNPCWKGQVVSVGNTGKDPNNGKCDLGYCTFADKEWVAVDRYSGTANQGDVYVSWNSFTTAGSNNGQSQIMLSTCTPDPASATGFTGCTTPIVVSKPGDVYTGGGSYLTVTRDGHVLVVYYNFGTSTTLYPIVGRVAVVEPGGQTIDGYIDIANLTQNGDNTTVPCLPNTSPPDNSGYGAPCQPNTYMDALAGVTMRAPGFIKIDADRSHAGTANVYVTFELCTTSQFFPLYDNNGNVVYTGNCPKTSVILAKTALTFGAPGTYSNTTPVYSNVTRTSPGQQFFPFVSVDEHTGAVLLSYNSTQDDPFQNEDSVYGLVSRNNGASFLPVGGASSTGRLVNTPYQITKDPAGYFGQGAPPCGSSGAPTGCPGYAPQNGDYLQGLAYFGRLYVHYTGTYVQKAFAPAAGELSFFDGTYPMNQDDNFLVRGLY